MQNALGSIAGSGWSRRHPKGSATGAPLNLGRRPSMWQSQTCRWLLAYLVLPNALFWVFGISPVAIPRAMVNVDYLVAGWAACYLSASLAILFFLFAFLVDVLTSTAPFYYFSQHDLLNSARFLDQLPWAYTVGAAAVLFTVGLVVAMLISWLAGPVSVENRPRVSFTLGAVCLALSVHGLSRWSHPDSADEHRLATSACRRLLVTAWLAEASDQAPAALIPVPSGTAALRQALLENSPRMPPSRQRNIVLVLVESYGLMNDSVSAARLETPFHVPALRDKYEIQTGTVRFRGATVAGEFRTLCGLQMEIASSQLSRLVSSQCLPKLLEKQGYHTTAIHGFRGIMFDRKWWYRDLGFEDALFLEDLRKLPEMKLCDGIFPGICDDDIARLLGEKLAAPGDQRPQFLYWLTLNSHLPIKASASNSTLFACGAAGAANPDFTVCNWMAQIYQLNAALAQLCANSDLPPTEFIIVGDHAPPFLSNFRRNQYSQTVVPFVHLVPRISTKRRVSSPRILSMD